MNGKRPLPDVPKTPCPEGYATLCAAGWDSWQEAFALQPTVEFDATLEAMKRAAAEASDDNEGVVCAKLGDETFKVHALGAKGGVKYRLENDDIQLLIGSRAREWAISARYTAAGLWEHSADALRTRCFEALRPYTRQVDPDCVRVSRADWCFDFHTPEFFRAWTKALSGSVVMHSSAKSRENASIEEWTKGLRGNALTLGKPPGLQVQVYDKALEIDEASGKTWMWSLWREMLGYDPWGTEKPRDVARLECRFFGEFLKNRNIRRPHELQAHADDLIAEALYTRRLTVPTADSNRTRWPMHPLWTAALARRSGDAMVPMGRKVTGRRDALFDRAVAQQAGSARSAVVLKLGEYKREAALKLMDDALARLEADPKHQRKVNEAMDRYSDVEEAR